MVHQRTGLIPSLFLWLQEKMTSWMVSVKLTMQKRAHRLTGIVSADHLAKCFNAGSDLTKPFEYLLATGNLTSKTGPCLYVKCLVGFVWSARLHCD